MADSLGTMNGSPSKAQRDIGARMPSCAGGERLPTVLEGERVEGRQLAVQGSWRTGVDRCIHQQRQPHVAQLLVHEHDALQAARIRRPQLAHSQVDLGVSCCCTVLAITIDRQGRPPSAR